MYILRLVAASVLVVMCSLAMVSCTESASLANGKVGEFWQWFAANEEQLYLMDGPTSEKMGELAAKLRVMDESLGCEIGPAPDNKKEFAVSANSHVELFPIVEKIAASAPPLKHWKIVAFRQPVPPEMLQFLSASAVSESSKEKFTVSAKDMRFAMNPSGDLTLYLKDYSGLEQQQRMAEMMVQQAVGEYDFAMKIGDIRFESRTKSNEETPKPLAQLASSLKELKTQ